MQDYIPRMKDQHSQQDIRILQLSKLQHQLVEVLHQHHQ